MENLISILLHASALDAQRTRTKIGCDEIRIKVNLRKKFQLIKNIYFPFRFILRLIFFQNMQNT